MKGRMDMWKDIFEKEERKIVKSLLVAWQEFDLNWKYQVESSQNTRTTEDKK
jgi:hypothetical protein